MKTKRIKAQTVMGWNIEHPKLDGPTLHYVIPADAESYERMVSQSVGGNMGVGDAAPRKLHDQATSHPMNEPISPTPANPAPSAADNNAPTPRTDANVFEAYQWEGSGYGEDIFNCVGQAVPADFARTLERELVEARAILLTREGELDSMSAALAAAQATAREAMEDKERLDWLASQCYYPYDHPQDGVFVVVSEHFAPHGAFTLERDGDRKSLRAAIDAAREGTANKGQP